MIIMAVNDNDSLKNDQNMIFCHMLIIRFSDSQATNLEANVSTFSIYDVLPYAAKVADHALTMTDQCDTWSEGSWD